MPPATSPLLTLTRLRLHRLPPLTPPPTRRPPLASTSHRPLSSSAAWMATDDPRGTAEESDVLHGGQGAGLEAVQEAMEGEVDPWAKWADAVEHSPIQGIHYGPSILHNPLSSFSLPDGNAKFPQAAFVPLSKHVFGLDPRPDILHRCIVFERSRMRSGSANTKTRSELAFSGRKLRQQKGTGKARLGSASNPSLRKGATAFGPKPTDHSLGLPRRVWELGVRLILSERWREGNLHVVPRFKMGERREASEEVARYVKEKGWGDAVFLAGGRWSDPEVFEGEETDAPCLREALSRRHLLKPGIRLGQKGPAWDRMQLDSLFPILNSIDLAHPTDLFGSPPSKPHPTEGEARKKPGRIGVYHLMLRKRVVMDLKALGEVEDWLTRDMRRLIGAVGTTREEAEAVRDLAAGTFAARMS